MSGDKRRPMGIAVKICGITTVEAADAAIRAGRRLSGPRLPSRLAAHLAGRAGRRPGRAAPGAASAWWPLLVDADDEAIAAAIAAAKPDFLQLHGGETPARVGEIRARSACR